MAFLKENWALSVFLVKFPIITWFDWFGSLSSTCPQIRHGLPPLMPRTPRTPRYGSDKDIQRVLRRARIYIPYMIYTPFQGFLEFADFQMFIRVSEVRIRSRMFSSHSRRSHCFGKFLSYWDFQQKSIRYQVVRMMIQFGLIVSKCEI